MDARDLVLAVIAGCPGEKVPGRTVLQKIIYFCTVRLNLDISYFPHYFGPYSEEVAQATRSLCSLGFLSESKHLMSTGTWGYEYHLTPEGKEALSDVRSAKVRQVQALTSKITTLPGWDHSQTISCTAKVYLILHKNRKPMTKDAIAREADNLGWHLDAQTIGRVVSFLEALGFVTTK